MSECIFNKVANLRACNIIKKRLQDRYFPVNTVKFLRTAFYRTSPLAASEEYLLATNKSLPVSITCIYRKAEWL